VKQARTLLERAVKKSDEATKRSSEQTLASAEADQRSAGLQLAEADLATAKPQGGERAAAAVAGLRPCPWSRRRGERRDGLETAAADTFRDMQNCTLRHLEV
jgi:hypothetical protein